MVLSAENFVAWNDFPKGLLKVLLMEKDESSALETKSKLEEMDYKVSLYHNEEDAMEAVSKQVDNFHVAIVEVTSSDHCGSFKILEIAQDLPTIVISNVQCLNTMMKCIALGAAEFLQKPLSEDKLRSIWQHAVHKAFNAKSLKLIKDQNNPETTEKDEDEAATVTDRLSAPSTPQLEQGGRFQPDEEFQETTNCSALPCSSSCLHSADNSQSDSDGQRKKKLLPNSSSLNGARNRRKKIKVDWTAELHRRFVQAVEQLGAEQAIPSKILQLMQVEGLTRHNVASHLQKYRMQKRHVLPKDEDRNPIMAYPSPFHPHSAQMYPVWGHPSYHGVQIWGTPTRGLWHPPTQTWPWKSYPLVADAWGCPVRVQYAMSSPRSVMGSGLEVGGERNEEVIDRAVREAMSKPWLPLPLGLKPPSTDAVLAELHRVGIAGTPFTDRRP
ncbi:two-component response regulator-like APRR2 [Zingiber officinale]|uniref:Two-component response regulator-like APRR2 n=1 Tax=Zingiber officinale TaxID=94328 RepID=A0A8J5LHW5_ZINOF|nr:two-component response regulator-like APRR2 [Zingiber officinale]KAG6519868.1 hypothetical protein ZIOFF_016897 [Zingiber officinale]